MILAMHSFKRLRITKGQRHFYSSKTLLGNSLR